MTDKTCLTVTENFASHNENELRENIRRTMNGYISLAAKSGGLLKGDRPADEMCDLLPPE